MTTSLPNKLCSGPRKATEEGRDLGKPGEEIWSQKWGQQDSSRAYCWRKIMVAVAQDRTGLRKVVC